MKIISLLRSDIPGGRRGWTIPLLVLLSSCLTNFLQGQAPQPEPPPAPQKSAPQQLSQEELNKLLAPIALYPDALIALILPASTVPSDLVLAERYIASNGDPARVANQPWDDSVKSLVRYPDVLTWMDQNLEWTTQVGEAFLDQPADVMNTIQQLRAQAIAAGNLVDTPQQRIVKEETCIRIVPAEPDAIYVPRYDPEVVYAQPYLGPALTFGVGFAVGSWLNYDCDWPRRRVCVGDWNPGWKHKWKRNRGGNYDVSNTISVVNISSGTARIWQPNAKIQRQHWKRQRSHDDFDAQNTTPSYSKANKHSQSARIKRSKGGSQNSGASYSKPEKSQSAGASGKGSGGGGHKSGKKGDGKKGDKGKK